MASHGLDLTDLRAFLQDKWRIDIGEPPILKQMLKEHAKASGSKRLYLEDFVQSLSDGTETKEECAYAVRVFVYAGQKSSKARFLLDEHKAKLFPDHSTKKRAFYGSEVDEGYQRTTKKAKIEN